MFLGILYFIYSFLLLIDAFSPHILHVGRFFLGSVTIVVIECLMFIKSHSHYSGFFVN